MDLTVKTKILYALKTAARMRRCFNHIDTLATCDIITKNEETRLIEMLNSPDKDNLTIAEGIINFKMNVLQNNSTPRDPDDPQLQNAP